MKKLLFTTIISLISYTVISQSCVPEELTSTAREEIDNFQTNIPGSVEMNAKADRVYHYRLKVGDAISNGILTKVR